jgi:hypothetical protein
MKQMDQDTRLLIEALRRSFPTPPKRGFNSWSVPPLNVLDCVLSLNRRYDTFCKPRVHKFASQHPEVDTLARMVRLINRYSTPLEFSITELDYRDGQRAATLVGVLTHLIQAQKAFKGSSETSRLKQWAKKAKPGDYEALRIRGFGLAGFQYLRMLFRAQTAKPDVHIRRFVSNAVGHAVGDVQALTLLEVAAKRLRWPPLALDNAIWDRNARGSKLE